MTFADSKPGGRSLTAAAVAACQADHHGPKGNGNGHGGNGHDGPETTEGEVTLAMVRAALGTAVVCDALDALGYPRQSPRAPLVALTGVPTLVGRCRTTLWADMAHPDPEPYALELAAVDACGPDDVLVAAAGGSTRSGVWGELLSTAARARGVVGAVIDGAVRDVARMSRMAFPVFARGTCPYDSLNRQRVVDVDVPVEVGGVLVCPGDLLVADVDGLVVVPQAVEREALRRAWRKARAEDATRAAIRGGLSATAAYARFGVL